MARKPGLIVWATESIMLALGRQLSRVHPLDFDPDDKWDLQPGTVIINANAVAIGAYYRPNEDTMFSVGGSFSGGENYGERWCQLEIWAEEPSPFTCFYG